MATVRDLINAINLIVDKKLPYDLAEGVVVSVNNLTASLSIIGTSGNQDAIVVQGIPIAPNNRCIAVRPKTSTQWIVLATFGTRKTGYIQNVATDDTTQLFPPQNFGVITTLPGFLIFHWDTPPQKAVTFQVQISTDGVDTHAQTVLNTRGSYYIVSSIVSTYVRVRSIDATFKYSNWTPWLIGVPASSIYSIFEVDGDIAFPRAAINLIAGENIEITATDNEDDNSTDVTIKAKTLSFGVGVVKTLVSNKVSAGTDHHLILAAAVPTTDDLIEITGLSVGDKVIVRVNSGDTITVKYNDAGATDKILLIDEADLVLSDWKTLELIKIESGKVVQSF